MKGATIADLEIRLRGGPPQCPQPNIKKTINHSEVDIFFNQFNLKPDYYLSINNNSQLSQISSIQLELENLFNNIGNPDLIIVPGDVNSTLASALTAASKTASISECLWVVLP